VLRTLVLGSLCLLAPALASADAAEAQRWLERIPEAVRELNYEGTFVYSHGGDMEAMRIVHRGEGGEAERLYALTGAGREIVRDDQKVTSILPDNRSVMVDRRQLSNPLSNVVSGNVPALTEIYSLEMLGDDRIANRSAKQIGVFPNDKLRYGYRLWVDEETGLLLRADLLDEQQEPVEQLMFIELTMPQSIPASALQPQTSGEGFTWHRSGGEAEAAPAKNSHWDISDLPKGFELVLHEKRALDEGKRSVEHLMYSDGLASLSVYIEKATPETSFTGHSRMGALNAYGRDVDKHQVTVVGEVPAATVRQVAESLRLKRSAR
jgi:sigma-E factor negative regulatory protein RseB